MIATLRPGRAASAFLLSLFLLLCAGLPANALSELKRDEAPAADSDGAQPAEEAAPPPVMVEPVPLPNELPALSNEPQPEPDGADEPGDPAGGETAKPRDIPMPEILRDISALPEPVQRMRELIMEAARTGEVERLRPLQGTGENMTSLSFGGIESDPIAFLRGTSGDGQGQEILAILLEVLEAGFVRMDPGTDHELYVWPYFYAAPLDKLSPPQKVELFKLVTAGDYEDMQAFGAYIFYRAGITPEGRWIFFVAGD
ncbi:MAG: hypothetical protein CMJ42_14745 [Phyllobacteriaceae bacterium]|nr:hypothetical protein [Phyllobacteriaceae bacterium]